MKKKRVLISIVMLIVIVSGTFLFTRFESLGNINNNYSEPTTATSTISFSGKTSNSIRFSFESKIQSGDLHILLYDSEGNEVYSLDKARKLKTFFTLNKSDTYTLAAECKGFIGNYKVKVYRVK